MQNDTSHFVVNIVPLQNIQSNTSGIDTTTQIGSDLSNVQSMVNFNQKRIYADFLSAYTAGTSIQVLSPLNLSNVGITSNGTATTLGGTGTVSTVGAGSTILSLASVTAATSTAFGLNLSNRAVFTIGGTGNSLFYDSSDLATEFRVSSMTLYGDLASFSSMSVITTCTFGGICYAQNFVTLSDVRAKSHVLRSHDKQVLSKFEDLHAYSYRYIGQKETDTGLLAQELESVFPEAVTLDAQGVKYVKYNAVVALLVEAVGDLARRLRVLEEKVAV
jgi:hypothetical protein